ncbi:phosphopantetheine-binding protein [Streptomyces sp. NPDC002067]
MSDGLRAATSSVNLEEIRQDTLEWVSELLEEPAKSEDNFLDLGGHSMLALQLSGRAKEKYGAEYDIKTLFESTLEKAAADLASRAATA